MPLVTKLHSPNHFPGQELLSSGYLEADENIPGQRSHLTLFCLLFFFHLNWFQLFLSEEILFLHSLVIPVLRLCVGFAVV